MIASGNAALMFADLLKAVDLKFSYAVNVTPGDKILKSYIRTSAVCQNNPHYEEWKDRETKVLRLHLFCDYTQIISETKKRGYTVTNSMKSRKLMIKKL